jgi:2-amino-4-hydroxy-6-hydroxymethyldihydropteridine diphosphokinase
MVDGRWLLAGGRRQVAGGRWQVAGGRRQVAGGRWQVAGGRWQVAGGGGRWQMAVADGRWQMADGRWQMAGGRWQVADGKWQGTARIQGEMFCIPVSWLYLARVESICSFLFMSVGLRKFSNSWGSSPETASLDSGLKFCERISSKMVVYILIHS